MNYRVNKEKTKNRPTKKKRSFYDSYNNSDCGYYEEDDDYSDDLDKLMLRFYRMKECIDFEEE